MYVSKYFKTTVELVYSSAKRAKIAQLKYAHTVICTNLRYLAARDCVWRGTCGDARTKCETADRIIILFSFVVSFCCCGCFDYVSFWVVRSVKGSEGLHRDDEKLFCPLVRRNQYKFCSPLARCFTSNLGAALQRENRDTYLDGRPSNRSCRIILLWWWQDNAV